MNRNRLNYILRNLKAARGNYGVFSDRDIHKARQAAYHAMFVWRCQDWDTPKKGWSKEHGYNVP